MVRTEYRLMVNKYDGTGEYEYIRSYSLVEVLKAWGVLEAMHPKYKGKLYTRTLTEWKERRIDD